MWKNLSIAKKLYLVFGIMAVLIAGELLTLSFAMSTLSAARAFVGGESLWSKAQKNALFSLQRFGFTRDEKDWQAFLDYLKIPEGDHRARLALLQPKLDYEDARQGFLQGQIHPDDIPGVIKLLRRFYWISYIQHAIEVWTRGDELLAQFRDVGQAYHDAIRKGHISRAGELLMQAKQLNEQLTPLETEFSEALGAGSRWLEHVVLTLLILAVMLIEGFGISLTFRTSRAISRGLNEIDQAATLIGQGELSRRVPVRSRDELGRVAEALNAMGELLERSYTELEKRVEERTSELKKLAEENARLYQDARNALSMRDEFMSVASHELRTPITALAMRLELFKRSLSRPGGPANQASLEDMASASLQQTKRLTQLVDQLLDLTRLRHGKLELKLERTDLAAIIHEVAGVLAAESARRGSPITVIAPAPVFAHCDVLRMTQVVTNLVSNAIKYGNGRPIEIEAGYGDGHARVRVRDQGLGIAAEALERIFERFERAEPHAGISGLGLGLYITRQIVEAHGGRIEVQSSVGHGSMFSVSLPR